MTKVTIRDAVTRAIAEIGDKGEAWGESLSDALRPVGGLPEFDSYSAEEAIAAIGDFLDIDFPLRFNPFIAPNKTRAASIGEIVQAIHSLVARTEGVTSGSN